MRIGAMGTQLRVALLDAFRKPNEMRLLVSDAGLGTSFDNFLAVEGTAYDAALGNLLNWVESHDLLVRFLTAAGKANPRNPELRKVLGALAGLEARFAALSADKTFDEAESIVLHGVLFEDVGPWLDQLGRKRWAVCRIEPQPQVPHDRDSVAGYGTGYLVAPDVVMTNYHVAAPFWSDPAKATRVRVRFDYGVPSAGGETPTGTALGLVADWTVPQFKGDPRQHPWQCLASPVKDLDFALLRLERATGDDVLPGGTRGFLGLIPYEFSQSDPLLILQHPAAAPLKLSFGAVEDLEPPNHVRYKVNTQGGSSGAPCLTQELKVAAIHHYGLADRNRGVTQKAILNHLDSKQEQLKFLGLTHLLP